MANGYTVVKQEEIQALGPDATLVDVMRVTFTTDVSGQTAYVTVPVAGYSAQAVNDAIVPLVASIDAVQAL